MGSRIKVHINVLFLYQFRVGLKKSIDSKGKGQEDDDERTAELDEMKNPAAWKVVAGVGSVIVVTMTFCCISHCILVRKSKELFLLALGSKSEREGNCHWGAWLLIVLLTYFPVQLFEFLHENRRVCFFLGWEIIFLLLSKRFIFKTHNHVNLELQMLSSWS